MLTEETKNNSIQRPPWGRVPFDQKNRELWGRSPFDLSEYEARWKKVAAQLRDQQLDAVVAYATPGEASLVRYLTNFDSSLGHSVAIVTSDAQCILLTNGLLRSEPMHSQIWLSPIADVRRAGNERHRTTLPKLGDAVVQALQDYGAKQRIGFAGSIPYATYQILEAFAGTKKLVESSAILNDVMAIKSAAEIALFRRAHAVSDRAFERVRSMLGVGINELELAGAVFEEIGRGGADGLSFPLSLVGGPRSGHKQVGPIDYALQDGDLVFMDLGIAFEGYMTDNSRGGVVGKATAEQKRFLEAGEKMTLASVSVAGPGVSQQRLDDAAFEVACEYGFVDDYYFRAHGISTTPFSMPRFIPTDETPLRVGELFVVEPMLIRQGYGTACDEFTVLVTETGVEVLSTAGERWW